MPSGYKYDGTDLDDIFHLVNSEASISQDYKVNNSTTYGRYLERTSNSPDAVSSNDIGYKINDVDLNRLYVRNNEVGTKTIDIRSANGAKIKIDVTAYSGTILYVGHVTGGDGGVGDIKTGGDGGTGVFIVTGSVTSDQIILAVAGGSGGSGYDWHGEGGGVGGAAGYENGYAHGNFIVYDGKDGADAKGGGNYIYTKPTGGKGGTTIAGSGGGGGSGNTFLTVHRSPPGNDAEGYYGGDGSGKFDSFKNADRQYGGGGGGSGFRGGGGGSAATIGRSGDLENDTTPSGGGGGSSAIRTSSFPDGIVSVVINSIESNQGGITMPAYGAQIEFK